MTTRERSPMAETLQSVADHHVDVAQKTGLPWPDGRFSPACRLLIGQAGFISLNVWAAIQTIAEATEETKKELLTVPPGAWADLLRIEAGTFAEARARLRPYVAKALDQACCQGRLNGKEDRKAFGHQAAKMSAEDLPDYVWPIVLNRPVWTDILCWIPRQQARVEWESGWNEMNGS